MRIQNMLNNKPTDAMEALDHKKMKEVEPEKCEDCPHLEYRRVNADEFDFDCDDQCKELS